ncbi:MAG: translation initiation factor [Bacteroidales bacterium]|nr:translation initiation factor [Bacteroidales bacterium]
MSKKFKSDKDGIVYSTNPNFSFNTDEPEVETLAPGKQRLKVLLDSKSRAGKTVTLISGFTGKSEDLVQLSKILKNKFGIGGSVKDNEIILQGSIKDKVIIWLKENGYSNTK